MVDDPVGSLATNRYHDRGLGLDATKLLPGDFFVTDEDVVLVTVLGSCVAACIRDPALGIGGMNHFMLPDAGLDSSLAEGHLARYGTYSMEVMIEGLVRLGARRDRLEAKVFGGGQVMVELGSSRIGARNAVFVRDYLRRAMIPVVAADLEGRYARKLYFFPRTGRALVKTLRVLGNDTIVRREREYRRRLAAQGVPVAVGGAT
jgi:chemotaxis protein CheD